jgi:hypothetical protein
VSLLLKNGRVIAAFPSRGFSLILRANTEASTYLRPFSVQSMGAAPGTEPVYRYRGQGELKMAKSTVGLSPGRRVFVPLGIKHIARNTLGTRAEGVLEINGGNTNDLRVLCDLDGIGVE